MSAEKVSVQMTLTAKQLNDLFDTVDRRRAETISIDRKAVEAMIADLVVMEEQLHFTHEPPRDLYIGKQRANAVTAAVRRESMWALLQKYRKTIEFAQRERIKLIEPEGKK